MTQRTDEKQDFTKGDWIVHLYHGVGQVKGVVSRQVDGEKHRFYRVTTDNSTLFIPVREFDEERLRPAADEKSLKQALKVLKDPPEEMADDHNDRRRRIREVKSEGSLKEVLRLVRDLSWRRYDKKLNNTEERALRRFKDRLLREMAVAMDTTTEDARRELNRILRHNRPEEQTES
ncbi:MAG TPA: CarD family transcriptional regulator [Anaerolineales bacterium]|jgi:RNA polymerase-interacting CarD/CdnL/TRCF family regulator